MKIVDFVVLLGKEAKKVPDTNGTVLIFAVDQRDLRYFT